MKTILLALTLSLLLGTALSANAAPLKAKAPQAVVTPAVAKGPTAGDWRVPDPENVVVIDTTKGRIIVELSPELGPNHVVRFKELTREGFYNGLKFHRVIDEFMAQTGDPQGTGEGGSTKPDVAAEFTYRRGPQSLFTPISQPIGIQSGFVGAVPVARWFVTLTLTTATFQVYDKAKTELIAANAVNASALATDAVTEIQSGLATQASVDTIQADTNDIQTRLPAALESGRIAAVLDSAATAALVDLIWDEATSGHTTAGTYGGRIVRSTNSITEVQITGSNHIAADVHEFQAGVITAGDFAANSITASALATDAVTEIQSGLATASALATAKTILDKVDTGLVVDGAVYQFTANMLELAPSGTGGDATLAKQTEILAAIQGSEVIQVASPNVSGNLVLTQGDDYDGVANPKASWTVTTDYTSGWTVRLTIRSATDAVIATATGSVVSSTVVSVTIAAPTGLTMTGCPGQWQGKFDVELTHSSGKKKTIALGTCYINEDQTR
jgi:cyclophilin family peptidyl-prolyl cis-trans isomerase